MKIHPYPVLLVTQTCNHEFSLKGDTQTDTQTDKQTDTQTHNSNPWSSALFKSAGQKAFLYESSGQSVVVHNQNFLNVLLGEGVNPN